MPLPEAVVNAAFVLRKLAAGNDGAAAEHFASTVARLTVLAWSVRVAAVEAAFEIVVK